jgi:hypothetical protein
MTYKITYFDGNQDHELITTCRDAIRAIVDLLEEFDCEYVLENLKDE